jgi:16S rRNA (uracil1498-N3)-methyltransferase
MDMLVEKAAELGASVIQPLLTERSVLRLSGERAQRRRDHWQAVAVAASEQCGRTRVPRIEPVRALADWVGTLHPGATRWMLALDATPLASQPPPTEALLALSGPEGGLSAEEERLAARAGFVPIRLGSRTLRADTAPLALLSFVALQCG